MSLKIRLAVIVAATVALAIAVAATISWVLAARALRNPIDVELRATATATALTLDRVPSSDEAAILLDRPSDNEQFGRGGDRGTGRRPARDARRGSGPASDRNPFRFQVLDPDGTAAVSDGMAIDDVDVAIALGDRRATIRTVSGTRFVASTGEQVEGTFRAITVPVATGGAIKFAREIGDVERALDSLRNRLILGALTGIAVAAALGWFIARRITRPISAVTDAAGQLADLEDLPGRITIDRNDEVGQLATSFNRLIGALEVSREQQRRLVADASHELRTPLTSLRMKIEMLQQMPDIDAAQRQTVLDGSVEELESLTDLVAELVDLAADPNATKEDPVHVRLDQLAQDVVDRAIRRTGRRIDVHADESWVSARPSALTRAISNLVDNAIKYSPDDSPVQVEVRDGSIQVRDHGPGIDAEERAFVFDRFYRSAKARTRPGSGLGLAIVKQVADDHEGDVWVDEPDDRRGGTVVGLRLPIAVAN